MSDVATVLNEVKVDALVLWDALKDKRVSLDEVFEIVPSTVRLAMKLVGKKQITNEQKHDVVLEVIKFGWGLIDDYDIPWIPNFMERMVKGWVNDLIESWLLKQVDKLITEYWSTNHATGEFG